MSWAVCQDDIYLGVLPYLVHIHMDYYVTQVQYKDVHKRVNNMGIILFNESEIV